MKKTAFNSLYCEVVVFFNPTSKNYTQCVHTRDWIFFKGTLLPVERKLHYKLAEGSLLNWIASLTWREFIRSMLSRSARVLAIFSTLW